MSNSLNTPESDLVAGTTARATDINARMDAIEVAFDNTEAAIDLALKVDPAGTTYGGSDTMSVQESVANRSSKEIGFDASGDLVLISSAFTWQGDWATSTAYIKNDVVRDSSSKNLYAVTADYTSGASVSADVTAGSLSMAINVEDVETAKSAAETAQTAAETAETNAETAETNAATSETNAAASETNAAASETAAAASETAAASSETNAGTSETNAAASETAAAASQTAAASSATAAASSETNAASSATSASTSETNAATSATNAATSETNAATSATNAATSETNAATSATAASTAQTAAETAQTAAEAAVDNIESFYLGSASSDPTVDDNGNALTAGDWYFNTTTDKTRIYTGSAWQDAVLDVAGIVEKSGATGSAQLPSGTTAQRDGTPAAGYLRYNSTESEFEGYDGSSWGAVGGVTTGKAIAMAMIFG